VGSNQCGMKMKSWIWTALLLGISAPGYPCSIVRSVSPEEIVHDADVIVRAVAVGYAVNASTVRFKTIEVVKGNEVPSTIDLPGDLVDRDDFNDGNVPYKFVRPNGRHGNCFATSYRLGAEFLLMLKLRADSSYTVHWAALGPVNEQLRSADDPWLLWVRDQVRWIGVDGSRAVTKSQLRTPDEFGKKSGQSIQSDS
jgi:hypothetical protein